MPSAELPAVDSPPAPVAKKKAQKRQHDDTTTPKTPKRKRVAKEKAPSDVSGCIPCNHLSDALTVLEQVLPQTTNVPKPSTPTNKHVPEIDRDVFVDLVKKHGQHWVVVADEYNKTVGVTAALMSNRWRSLKKYAEEKWAREGGAVKNDPQETQPGNLYEEKEKTDEVDEKASDE
ncbi:hypothetical protein HKX48_005510 [Thoreauomyces humboldtii]|nr:hypothetical protein HKX48_005510 [Thoreauomyces humboldtii]